MRHLEEKKIIHSDLAARNVLVAEYNPGPKPLLHVKVADFGLARLVDQNKLKEQSVTKSKATFFITDALIRYSLSFFQNRRPMYPRNGQLPKL